MSSEDMIPGDRKRGQRGKRHRQVSQDNPGYETRRGGISSSISQRNMDADDGMSYCSTQVFLIIEVDR